MIETTMGRRALLGGMVALGAAACAPPAVARGMAAERRLAFRNVHTGERIDARYFGANGFDSNGLAELDHGLRDWRTNAVAPIDRALLDLLVAVRDRLGVAPQHPFDLISGYRSPATNGALRQKGGAHTGVATKSQHMLGKATDIAMPGIAIDRLKLAALSIARGGVGAYLRDGFVHVDTGRVRSW